MEREAELAASIRFDDIDRLWHDRSDVNIHDVFFQRNGSVRFGFVIIDNVDSDVIVEYA